MLDRQKLGSHVVSQLRNEIIAGELRAGTPLRLASLAERLDVSVTPVREALFALERQGLVTSRLNRGFVVNELSVTDFEDAYALHAFMAARLTKRAVGNLSENEIDELCALDDEMRERSNDGDLAEAGDLNHEIHRRIYQAGGSDLMLKFLRETTPFVNRRHDPNVPGWADVRSDGHAKILEALRARDAETAARSMSDHILRSGELAVRLEGQGGRRQRGETRRPR